MMVDCKNLGNFFFSSPQTFCTYSELTTSDIDKRFFASKRRRNREHSVRFTFFRFRPLGRDISDFSENPAKFEFGAKISESDFYS